MRSTHVAWIAGFLLVAAAEARAGKKFWYFSWGKDEPKEKAEKRSPPPPPPRSAVIVAGEHEKPPEPLKLKPPPVGGSGEHRPPPLPTIVTSHDSGPKADKPSEPPLWHVDQLGELGARGREPSLVTSSSSESKDKGKDKDKDKGKDKDKDKERRHEERKWVYIPPPKPRHEPKTVRRSDEFPLAKHKIRVSVLGRSDLFATPLAADNAAKAWGRRVARAGIPLVTGGGKGIPKLSEKEAFEAGGVTWAVPPTDSAFDYNMGGHGETTSVVYLTGTGSDLGSIEREAPLTQITNIRSFFNGGPGTFGELIAGLHEPGVLAFHVGSGGVAEAAPDKILPFIGVPSHVRVVTSHDSDRLFDRATAALKELEGSGVSTMPSRLYIPKKHESVLSSSDRKDRHVMAFLSDDGGKISARDKATTMKLVDLALTKKMHDKSPLAIVAAKKGVPEDIVTSAMNKHDVPSFAISGESGNTMTLHAKGKPKGAAMKIIKTGKGDGVGRFALHREVVEDANVLFITSAHYENLSGLAFAMRQEKEKRPVIAILELESTGSNKVMDMLRAIERKWADRVVSDSDPVALLDKVEQKLKPKKEYKWKSSWDDDYGYEGGGSFRFRVPFDWEKNDHAKGGDKKSDKGDKGGDKGEKDKKDKHRPIELD